MLRFLSRHNDTPELRSANHLLRLPRYGDFRQWHVLRSESRQFLQPWEPSWRPDELTEGSFRTRVVRNGQECSSGTAVSFLLFEKETLLVGGITIGYIRRGAAQSCMIGYWVGERYAAQGHMSAALKLVIPYIFNGLQLHRIEAACIPENFKSIRLLENAGFQREGLLREYLKINGQWRDHTMFSLIADTQSSSGTKYDT
jgi:ribosomal-protein-alanine N-acetyltransferase